MEHRVLLFSIACHSILLWRLWRGGLSGVYLYLTIFLAAETVQDVAFYPLRFDSSTYAWSYILSMPVVWILAYLVILELYRLTLEDYPGIASVGRKAVTWCMGLAVVISAIYALPDLTTTHGPAPVTRIYAILERSTVLGLLVFLVLIQLFLYRYRLPLSRNRMVYATGYAVYFGIAIAQDIVWTALSIRVPDFVTLWAVAAANVILVVGAVLLSQEGEAKVMLESIEGDPDRARMQQQLAEMNRMLMRAARGRG